MDLAVSTHHTLGAAAPWSSAHAWRGPAITPVDRAPYSVLDPQGCFERFSAQVSTLRDVRARTPFPAELRALAGVQGGVLSRAQLLGHGLSRRVIARLLRDQVLHRLTPGIYSVDSGVSWQGRAWAGVLLGGERAVLGFEAAGVLHGFLTDQPDELVVFAPAKRAPRAGWQFLASERAGAGEPPRTSVEATVLDLCASRDEDEIAALIADVISAKRTSAKRLRPELSARTRQRHRALITGMVGEVAAGAHSALERRFLKHVEQAHGLPTALRQAQLGSHRCDAWYREYGVIAELDSRLHHDGGNAFRDLERDNEHALAGLITFRFGWSQVSGIAACQTALLLGQALISRGWEGPIQPCSHCRSSFR